MKKKSTIIQWCIAGAFALSLSVTKFHWTSLLVMIAAVLMMPLTAVQNIVAKIKINRWVAVVTAFVLMFAAIGMQPPLTAPNEGETEITFATTTTAVATTTSSNSSVVTTTTAQPTTANATTTRTTRQQTTYVLNTNTKKIHRLSCRYVKDIKAENYQEYHGHSDVLTAQGYEFCKVCF